MIPDVIAENTTRVIIFTDSLEAIKALRTPPRRHTTPHRIKELCGTFQRDHNIDIQVQWIPGHTGNPGNEEAHRLARETILNHPSESAAPSLSHNPSPEERRKTLRQESKKDLRATIPELQHPIPRNIPRAAQVLLTKARTGYALTEDIVARWEHYHQHKNAQVPPDRLLCSLCHQDRPTISHLLWSCRVLEGIRARHKPPGVTSLQDWLYPRNNANDVLLGLWAFVKEAYLVNRT